MQAGLELDLYDVLTFPDSKDASIDSYMPYLAELYDDITTFKPRDGLPDQNMEELLNKIFETVCMPLCDLRPGNSCYSNFQFREKYMRPSWYLV